MKKFSVGVILRAIDKMSGPAKKMARKTGRAIKGIGAGVGRLTSSLMSAKGAIAALATGFAAVKAASIVTEYGRTTAELGRFARQAGISVRGLQEWQHAAAAAGIDAEQFQDGVNELNLRMAELKYEGGEAADFLKQLSPAFYDQLIAAKGTEEAFGLIVKALAKVSDPQKRAILSAKLFGEEAGFAFTRLGELGTEQLAKLRKEASKYGLITGEHIKQAQKWQGSIGRLKTSFGGLTNALSAHLLPALRPMIDALGEWIRRNRELISKKVSDAVKGIAEWVQRVDWAGIIEGAGKFFGVVGDILGKVNSLVESIGGWKTVMIGLGGIKLVSLVSGLSAANPLMLAAAAAIAAWASAIYNVTRAYNEWLGVKDARKRNDRLDRANAGSLARLGGGQAGDLAAMWRGHLRVAEFQARNKSDRKAARDLGIDTRGRTIAELRRLTRERREGADFGLGSQQSSALKAALEAAPQSRPDGAVKLEVDFKNVPQGVQVSPPRSTGPVQTSTKVGRRMVGAGSF